MTESQNQSTNDGQAATSEPHAQREVSVWAMGGRLGVDVGNEESVLVPNTSGRDPRKEIYRAFRLWLLTGHRERAGQHY